MLMRHTCEAGKIAVHLYNTQDNILLVLINNKGQERRTFGALKLFIVLNEVQLLVGTILGENVDI